MQSMQSTRRIAAVCVNHNTSLYVELMLRSLFANHTALDRLGLGLTILDNQSEDDTATLRAAAAATGVPILPSGFTTHTQHNSHGEILRRFVLDRPDATHYLFLDADIVFQEPATLDALVKTLDDAPEDVYAAAPRIGNAHDLQEIPEESRANIYERRLHPLCALFRNTPLFRRVAEHIGFSCARYLWADRDQYLDTNELMTLVMRTHGLRYIRAQPMVLHFFGVSYDLYGQDYLANKGKTRDTLLAEYRARMPLPAGAPTDAIVS